ncbi:MAG TPA: hypothetical protein VFB81_18185 [Myxococcales bacterium]|nr:hypothetical protein [Myxococcales bacterium]
MVALALCGAHEVCLAATPDSSPPQPHVLVGLGEVLYQRKMADACDLVIKLGFEAPDLTDAERGRLHLLAALRRLDGNDETGAVKAIKEALNLNRYAQLPEFASSRARDLLESARASLPPPPRKRRGNAPTLFPGTGQAPAPVPREPPAGPLCRAADAMYQNMQLEAAEVALDFAGTQPDQPLPREDQSQVALRKGILRMEAGDENRARAQFQRGLELDRAAKLPEWVPPKTLGVFQSVRVKMPPEDAPGKVKPQVEAGGKTAEPAPSLELKDGLLIGGGVALATGAIAIIASSNQTSPNQTGQIAGAVVGTAGVAMLVGGLVLTYRPEILRMQVTVAPTSQGGLLMATGRF